jgi:hypothetical protein
MAVLSVVISIAWSLCPCRWFRFFLASGFLQIIEEFRWRRVCRCGKGRKENPVDYSDS